MFRKVKYDDLDEILGWFKSRKIELTPDYLPETGFIVPGIAAGFIYKTDANFCIFESFVANPNATPGSREEALNCIVEAMIKEAQKMGYKDAYGFATSQSMIRRGKAQGFKHVEHCETIIKDLRK